MKRYKPLLDKSYLAIVISALVLIIGATLLVCLYPAIPAIVIIGAVDASVLYFLVSPLFGYVEPRGSSLHIRYGLILKKDIPYSSIRSVTKERRLYTDSMLSLKNALEHVNIRYNSFDVTAVSVVGNDELISEIKARIS